MTDAVTSGDGSAKRPRQEAGSRGAAAAPESDWFRVTLGSIGDGVITTDTDGRITFFNPVVEKLTGWTLDEGVGRPLAEVFCIIDQEDRRAVESPSVRAVREGEVVGLAEGTLLVGRDGTERPIADSAAPIRDDAGAIIGAVLIFRDVTERRRHEQAIQEALAYADNIIETLRNPFLVLDKELRVKTASRAFYDSFLVTKADTEGRLIHELGQGQWDVPQLRALLRKVLDTRQPVDGFVVEHEFPEIGRKVMVLNARPFPPTAVRPEYVFLAIEDATERRLAEHDVRASEAQYRRLFESAKDGILILDAASGRIIDANPYMTWLLGYEREDFVGKELWQIGVFKDRLENEQAFRELQENGYVRYEHLPLEDRDGGKADVEFVSNVYHVSGRSVAQCNIRDISERVRLEQQMQEQAQDLAELHMRKDEFLAMLAHELRNPLAPLVSALELLRLQTSEDSTQRHCREIMDRQVAHLTQIVDDLLDISRITTGRVLLRLGRCDARGVVEGAVETARPLIDALDHELLMSLPSRAVWIYGDRTRLEQVVTNLLTNAAKYSDRSSRIWLSVQQEEGECVVRVEDSGMGIDKELLPRIFDLFTQAERSLDRSQGGLGIGLSLVKRLVTMHGGTVDVASVLGRGSEFVVRLPVAASDEVPVADSDHGRHDVAGTALQVLVVDDNVDAAESLAMLVRAAGHRTEVVHDGPDAVRAALRTPPHVVLLDIGLSGCSGHEVARRMRQQAALSNAVLIAITGYGQESDRQASLDAGCDHHMVKPVDFSVIERLMATIRPTDPASSGSSPAV